MANKVENVRTLYSTKIIENHRSGGLAQSSDGLSRRGNGRLVVGGASGGGRAPARPSHVDGALLRAGLVIVRTHHRQSRVAWTAAVVKEAPEGELKEAVEGFAKVLLRVTRATAAAAHFVGVDVVKVGRVGGIVEMRHERRFLQAQPLVKVHVAEIRVRLHLGCVLA